MFYIDLQEKNGIKANSRMPMTTEACYSTLIMTEKMQGHIERVRALRNTRLTVAHIVETFARWRIIPFEAQESGLHVFRVIDQNRESEVG